MNIWKGSIDVSRGAFFLLLEMHEGILIVVKIGGRGRSRLNIGKLDERFVMLFPDLAHNIDGSVNLLQLPPCFNEIPTSILRV